MRESEGRIVGSRLRAVSAALRQTGSRPPNIHSPPTVWGIRYGTTSEQNGQQAGRFLGFEVRDFSRQGGPCRPSRSNPSCPVSNRTNPTTVSGCLLYTSD